jgi:septum site-determining protein MinC
MKAKQKNLRIFDIHIESEEDFFSYMNKNLILLKDYFMMINGETTPKIISFLDDSGLCYKLAKECNIRDFSKTNVTNELKQEEVQQETKPINSFDAQKESTSKEIIKTLLFNKTIRSGEEIVTEGNVTIFGRVNSGAKIICEGNVAIYGVIDGTVQCDGDYMIIKDLDKGHLIFDGNILEKDQFNGNLKKIIKSDEGPIIEDAL